MSAPLLTTKLFIPPARVSRVTRPQLLEKLDAGLRPGCRLILLSAPAGFGKTTLLSEWISLRAASMRFCWLSLDPGDNDPARFLRYVIAALQSLDPNLGQPAQALLQTPPGAEGLVSPESVLNALLNDLAPLETPLVLVLDDYHIIDSNAVHLALAYLIDHLPPAVRLVIATRSDPPLPFPRLRARDQITELRVADLRFSSAEAAAFLNEVMGLDLTPQDVAALETRTEGWIAGLQLASLAAGSAPDRASASSFVAAFAGSNRYILDYLAEEVLSRQPAHVQSFLLQTAVLDRFCASLCEEVLGPLPGASAQSLLEYLDRSNLFVVPLDSERRWYRYHNLFAEFLYSRLCSALAPGECQSAVQELQRRASAWFERQDLAHEAIEYAIRAADYPLAAGLIERKARWAVLTPGETGKMLHWLAAIPDEIILVRPVLCLTHAWVQLSAGHNPAAESYVAAALQAAAENPAGCDLGEIESEAVALRSLLSAMAGRLEEAIALSRQALENLPESEALLRSMMAFNLGLAYDMRGDVPEATTIYRQAVTLSQASGNPLITMIAAVQLADLELLQGRLGQAEAFYRQAVQLAGRLGGLPVTSMAYSGLGHILYEQNRLAEAEKQLGQAIALGRRWESTDILVISLLYQAQVCLARGQAGAALALMDQARAGLLGNLSSTSTVHSCGAYLARLAMRTGPVEPAARWARELNEKPAGFPQAYLRVMEGTTLIRVYLAQEQPAQAADAAARLLPDSQAGEIIEIKALQALAFQALGLAEDALAALREAFLLAAPEGYVRVFIDEGPPMARLLHLALARGVCPAYVRTLLAAFELPAGLDSSSRDAAGASSASGIHYAEGALIEPLSEREAAVLRLIALGLSNQAIAGRLVVAVSTIKTHINNIYGKLGVQTRVQAVTRARELRLLD